ncbi:MAG: type II toxin-antitoxin system VapC family toxin [Caulobacteraceae bacterium]
MIHLDTHVVLWLCQGRLERLSAAAVRVLEREERQVSPIVLLEFEYLFERGRLPAPPDAMLAGLTEALGVEVSEAHLADVVEAARPLSWTRDPFDRLIVANAMADGASLVTADEAIRQHCRFAVW